MASELSDDPEPQTVDLSGLPEPVAEDIKRLVQTLREKVPPQQAATSEEPTTPAGERTPLIGRLAHLGLKTPSLDEFKEASREAWANLPLRLSRLGEEVTGPGGHFDARSGPVVS